MKLCVFIYEDTEYIGSLIVEKDISGFKKTRSTVGTCDVKWHKNNATRFKNKIKIIHFFLIVMSDQFFYSLATYFLGRNAYLKYSEYHMMLNCQSFMKEKMTREFICWEQ